MAIMFSFLESLIENGLVAPGIRILDIGCSNLYDATTEDIVGFMRHFGVEDDTFAERISKDSQRRIAFAGELFDKVGMHYQAIDFAPDYKTIKFDLNRDQLPRELRGAFDLVINYGTSEHVINQANAFKIIHEACKPGGYIHHHLVAGGFFSHGYLLYTGRFAFDLAGYNRYEVKNLHLEQDDVSPRSDIRGPIRDYSAYFPALLSTPDCPEPFMRDTFIAIAYRKVTNSPFRFPLDLSRRRYSSDRREKLAAVIRRGKQWAQRLVY